ncbi:MAG: UvrD-helicase domain-containing protein [Elusimicrobia bacterium]|nr:UvrD-helicase domain-containing protein [Elusimicrobiota bacterium]
MTTKTPLEPAPRPDLEADCKARDAAAFELGKNIVVEAGAGTGKTTLLTDRIFHTLLAGGPLGKGVKIDRLAAVTFTNKAAGEIKERVSGLLLDILSPERIADPKRKAQVLARVTAARSRFGLSEAHIRSVAVKAVEDMDQACIGTIHHFASTVLRLFPLEAGLDPEFSVDMGEDFAELFEDEWLKWLSVELGEDAPRKKEWLEVLKIAALDDLKSLAMAMAGELPAECAFGPTAQVKAKLGRLLAEFKTLEGITDSPGKSSIRESIQAVAGKLAALQGSLSAPGAVPDRLPAWDLKSRSWPASWRGIPGEALYKRGYGFAKAVSSDKESLVRKAAALVEPFSLKIKEVFTRRGFVSNDGLLSKSLALVRDDKDARRELKARFDAIFIDEFQDTDPQQGEILLFLAESKKAEAGRWQDVELEPGKLFIVGDPKQSIYRFRGADMRAYDGFKGLMKAQGALPCALQRNFRSRAGIIAPVNAVFEKLILKEEGLQPEYSPILPAEAGDGKAEPPLVSIAAVRDPEDPLKTLSVGECRQVEARWIADWIRDNHGRNPASGGQGLAYKDIAVLFRITTEINVYLQALRDAGIPYAVESERYFYGSQEIIDFTNLLRVLDDPEDSLALAGLLRSPLVGITDQELCELREAGPLTLCANLGKAKALKAGTRDKLFRFFRSLQGLRRYAGKEPLDEFVSRVFSDTFLLELCSAAYHHEQTASNLVKFKRLARDANDSRGATLKEFIAEVAAAAEDPEVKEGESPLADEHYDAVRLLSIHKAKGLEYRVVLLPDLRHGKPTRKDKVREVDWSCGTVGLRLAKAKASDTAMALIEEEEARRTEYEALRLLYVAMTRAKDRLILLTGAMLRSGEAGSFAKSLRSVGAWVQEGESPSELELKPGLVVPVEYADKGIVSRLEKPTAKAGAKAGLQHAELAGLWRDRFEERDRIEEVRRFSTPTEYLHETEKGGLGEDDPGALAGSRGRRPAVKESPALLGEVCHKFLERWDFKRGGNPGEALEEALAFFSQQHPLADWGAIGKEAAVVLKSFLYSPAAIELASADIIDREAHFIMPANGQIVRGSIDILYRLDGRLWVGDYKTEGRGRERKAKLYLRQGQAYVEAVRQSLGEKAGFRLFFLREAEVLTLVEPGPARPSSA